MKPKFRAWDYNNGVFTCNFYVECDGTVFRYLADNQKEFINAELNISSLVKDTNGQEIYEMDFIQDEIGKIHLVVWDYYTCSLVLEDFSRPPVQTDTVIGNAYQTPEIF